MNFLVASLNKCIVLHYDPSLFLDIPDEPGDLPEARICIFWHGHLDRPGDGVRWEGEYTKTFCESFNKIRHQEHCRDSTYPPSLLLDMDGHSWWTWRLETFNKLESAVPELSSAFIYKRGKMWWINNYLHLHFMS